MRLHGALAEEEQDADLPIALTRREVRENLKFPERQIGDDIRGRFVPIGGMCSDRHFVSPLSAYRHGWRRRSGHNLIGWRGLDEGKLCDGDTRQTPRTLG